MNSTIQDAINEQIRAEFSSAYQYLAMAAHFEQRNLKGFAHWLRIQWEEETQHALRLYDFLLQRDGEIELRTIPQPEVSFETPAEAFEQVLAHEQHITERIHQLYEQAVAAHDYALQTLLHWFIDEQVEEEDSVKEILGQLQLIGDVGSNLFLLDRELSQRTMPKGA